MDSLENEGDSPQAAPPGLRLITYLAPGLPMGLFGAVGRHLREALGIPIHVHSDPTRSSPAPAGLDPFAADMADVGFLCAPGYLWLSQGRAPSVELAPAAFVFDDQRLEDRPRFFADLVVSKLSLARTLADLRGSRWVYNDPCSLTGYYSMLAALQNLGEGASFFRSARAIGSHHAAVRAVASGKADCAVIDSNARLSEAMGRGVRRIESFGPYTMQPIVVRAGLSSERKQALTSALLSMGDSSAGRAALAAWGVRRLAPVSRTDYEHERALIAGLCQESVRMGRSVSDVPASNP